MFHGIWLIDGPDHQPYKYFQHLQHWAQSIKRGHFKKSIVSESHTYRISILEWQLAIHIKYVEPMLDFKNLTTFVRELCLLLKGHTDRILKRSYKSRSRAAYAFKKFVEITFWTLWSSILSKKKKKKSTKPIEPKYLSWFAPMHYESSGSV